MDKKRFLIVGSGGRESAFAMKLAEDSILYAIIGHKNPTITNYVKRSGGDYLIGNPSDPETVLTFAMQNSIDYTFVSADEPLANGVVDLLLENNIKAIGGTKAATRIEWDKIYSIQLMKETCPEFTPFFVAVSNQEELTPAIEQFKERNLQVVVKPQGLTGGKGVKVMTEHLPTYQDAMNYASTLLKEKPEEQVLLVEKLHGIEFTIMGLTDGENLVASPASYDYPFRLEDDLGAGTGGMGCFTNNENKLPFMSDKDLDDCKYVMQRIIDRMKHEDLFFNGVLNAGFFKTKNGIRFMEFNGRFGDPEGLNILTVLKGSFSKLLEDIWHKNLSEKNVSFMEQASVIKYLVAKEYPEESPDPTSFYIDEHGIRSMGLNVFYASCIEASDHYETLKKSRVLAIGAVSDSIEEASTKIDDAIKKYVNGSLEYRKDIGSKANLEKLMRIAQKMQEA